MAERAGTQSQSQSQSQVRTRPQPHGLLHGYDPGRLFCEMLRPGQPPHASLALLLSRLSGTPVEALRGRAADAERDLL